MYAEAQAFIRFFLTEGIMRKSARRFLVMALLAWLVVSGATFYYMQSRFVYDQGLTTIAVSRGDYTYEFNFATGEHTLLWLPPAWKLTKACAAYVISAEGEYEMTACGQASGFQTIDTLPQPAWDAFWPLWMKARAHWPEFEDDMHVPNIGFAKTNSQGFFYFGGASLRAKRGNLMELEIASSFLFAMTTAKIAILPLVACNDEMVASSR